MILWAGVGAAAVAFAISALATAVTRRLAQRFGILDVPGRHKTHARPVPLLGGCAIFAGVLVPSIFALSMASIWSVRGVPAWLPAALAAHVNGAAAKAPLALGILAGALVLHVVGLLDDAKNLSPYLKLIAQLVVAGAVVLLGRLRVLTALGEPASSIVSVLWLMAITNTFNFLDNMDGLAAGVAVICAAALLGASASMGQLFVSAWLCLILGATAGFLPYNFPPASTFMGDGGSLVIGFLLGAVSCLTTYVRPGATYYLYGIFVPLTLMAVPLYDMVSVLALRIRDRHNPMVGDRRHFSHRLARRGMSVRTVVLTVYLCTAGTAIGASLLPHVTGDAGAILVFGQTLAILLIIAVLESGKA
jgi:UDP-GlcNAc:undecaprenyl-phosphate GlcNAc-1-phosphate transferase